MSNLQDIEMEPIDVPIEEPKKKEEPKVEPNKALPMVVDEKGLISAKDSSELWRYCQLLLQGTAAPRGLTTVPQVVSGIMMVRQLGFPDFAIRQVANIKGTMSIFGDLPLAKAQATREMTHLREIWFDKDYNEIRFENKNLTAEVFGAVCFMSRGKGEIQSFSFTVDDARKAGLLPAKEDSPWTKYLKIMLRYRARSIALKSLFADALTGVAIAEYDFNRLPGHEDLREVNETVADEVNKIFGPKNGGNNDGTTSGTS